MVFVLCEICRLKLPNLQVLTYHYLNEHSKFKLARELIRLSLSNKVPKVLRKDFIKRKNRINSILQSNKKATTIFSNNNVEILYRNNEIIIRDEKSLVDMEFSFDENSCDPNDNFLLPQTVQKSKESINRERSTKGLNSNNKIKNTGLKKQQPKNKNLLRNWAPSTSSSSVSSEESLGKFTFKKKIRKHRDSRDKTRHYKINISRVRNEQSLNETTGSFYSCHCRENEPQFANNVQLINSDTESASDTGKHTIKVFCSKCGNGYSDDSLLMEHMKIHQTHCRVCNEIFPTEQLFKEHIKMHIFKVFVCHICGFEFPVKQTFQKHFESHVQNTEDSILESVINMEEEYNVNPSSLVVGDHQTSINNILCYLHDDHDKFYNYNNARTAKVYCDICLCEVNFSDYLSHLRSNHHIYN